MLPIWPNTDRIPVWVWLLAIAGFFGVGLWTSMPDFDSELAILRLQQGVAGGLALGGLLWTWWGGRVLWRIRALRRHGVEGEAEVTRCWSDSQRVERTGSFNSGSTMVRQYFVAYRFGSRHGEIQCKRMRIDKALFDSLRKERRFPVRYLPDHPSVNHPADLALGPVRFTRGLQLASGLALAGWSLIGLAPGTLW